jgi:hypothetical protein
MLKKAVIFVIFMAVFGAVGFGQNYRGTWTMTSGTTRLTLVLNQAAAGQVTGTLSSSTGAVFQLNGRVEEGVVIGTCKGQASSSQFEVSVEGLLLILTLIEVGATGEVTSRSLEFTRPAGGSSPSAELGLPPAPPGAAATKKAPAAGAMPASPQPAAAAPVAPQAPSGAGSPVSYPEMGIAFTTPTGWNAQKQGDAIYLTSTSHKGFILIQRHAYNSLEQMAGEASQGIVNEAGATRLMPASQFQAFGKNGLAVEFKGVAQGLQARSYAIGLIAPGGGGVTIMAATEAPSYTEAYPGFVRAIAGGLTFISAGPSAGNQAGGSSDTDLMRYFAGEWYSYSSGSTISGGAGTERKMTLCPNGLYRDSSEFSASGGGWGAASGQAGWGRWTIQGDKVQGVIIVTSPNGQSKRIAYRVVSKEQQTINFAGVVFAFAGEAKCR